MFQIGVSPARIDILTSITGVALEEAWTTKTTITIDGLTGYGIGKTALVMNKQAVGRPKDKAEVHSQADSYK